MTDRVAAAVAGRRHIVCFGNPLHGDDGLGPAVYARLGERPLAHDVRVSDAGTAGPAAMALFDGYDRIVVVDVSRPAGRPGRVWRPTRDMVLAEATASGHGVGVGHLVRCLEATLDPLPAIDFVAVEAEVVAPFRLGLSEPVARAVDVVVDLLHREFGEVAHG